MFLMNPSLRLRMQSMMASFLDNALHGSVIRCSFSAEDNVLLPDPGSPANSRYIQTTLHDRLEDIETFD